MSIGDVNESKSKKNDRLYNPDRDNNRFHWKNCHWKLKSKTKHKAQKNQKRERER